MLTVGSHEALRQGLRDLGYVPGQDVVLEVRQTAGRPERVEAAARELARLEVDVIVATYPGAVFSARGASATIPIVMVNTPDPVELGLVASLARPGGHITGVTSPSVDLSIKQLALLEEAVPRASRVTVLWNPDNPWHPITVKNLQAQGRPVKARQAQYLSMRSPDEFATVYRTMMRERVEAVLILADPMTFVHRRRLAELAVTQRLPAMGSTRE